MSILGEDHSTTTATTTPANVIETLVGEGKKFKDIEALAKGKLESDAFIAKLQDEAKQLRDELSKKMSLEDQLARLSQGGDAGGATTASVAASNQSGSPVTSLEDVDAFLEKKLSQREIRQRQEDNLRTVNEALLKQYGDANKAKDAVKTIESSLGVNLTELARTSPVAAMRLLGANASAGGVPAERSTTHVGGHTSGEGERNNAYYEKLRKEMGNAKFYMNRGLQSQLHKDAQRLGDAFYN